MMGYLYTTFLLLTAGVFFTAFNLQGGIAEFGCVLGSTMAVPLIVISTITMRALGKEQWQKTDQLLFTAPAKVSRIVLGKFSAIPATPAVPLTVLTAYPLVPSLYGVVPLKESCSCFLAFFSMGAAYIAIGMSISNITESQIIATVRTPAIVLYGYLINGMGGLMGISAVSSAAGLVVVVFLGGVLLAVMVRSLSLGAAAAGVCEVGLGAACLMDSIVFEGALPRFSGFFSLSQRYCDFMDGIFDVIRLVYYLEVVVLFLFFVAQSVEKRRWDSFKGGYFKIGLYAVTIHVLMVVVVVLSNPIMHKFPSGYTRYNMSASGLYNISPQAREVVSINEAPVSSYLVTSEGKEDRKLTQLLRKYRDLSGRTTVEYMDPILPPGFVPEYTSDKVSDDSIIMVGEKWSRVLCNTDPYPINYDYDTGRITTDFDGEGQIVNAIHYMTSNTPSKVYLINGRGENELTESFVSAMEKENVETKPLNLTSVDRMPEGGGCLLLSVPVSDLMDKEWDVLVSYLEQGGRMLLITGITATRTPNLDQVLAGYGISAIQGMIMGKDSNYSIPSYPNFLFPEIRNSQITEPLIPEDSLLFMPNAHGIVKTEGVRSTAEVDGILTTSSNFYIKTDSSFSGYMYGDPVGPSAIGATAVERADEGEARIAWFSSSGMLMEEMDEIVGGNNTSLVLNSIGWMTKQENSITIRSEPASSASLRFIPTQTMRWSMLPVLAVPIAMMTGDSVPCTRGRRRQ